MNNEICVLLIKEEIGSNDMFDTMFSDLEMLPHYKGVVEKSYSHSRIMCSLRFGKLKKLTRGAFDVVGTSIYNLPKKIQECSERFEQTILLFANICFIKSMIPFKMLNLLKKKYKNVTWVLFYLDMMERPVCWYANYLRENGLFDLTYSFDKEDSIKNNLIFWNTPYSHLKDFDISKTELDLYYCGMNVELIPFMVSVAKACEENNLKYRMDLCGGPMLKRNFKDYSGIFTDEVQPYRHLLSRAVSAKCILELVLEGQQGYTLRPYEAVCYNRKLLTAHPNIKEFKYYNPEYMQYFEKVEDIDWEWIKKPVDVNFNYQNDFSPLLLVEDIRRRMGI